MNDEATNPEQHDIGGQDEPVVETETESSAIGTETPEVENETPDVEPPPPVVETRTPDYAPVTDTSRPNPDRSLSRFLDVEVTISAELGRVTIPIGELVELGEGSVVELNRSVTSPVDLMAQGQRVATGEVVVIDDCFAVRIKSIESVEPGGG